MPPVLKDEDVEEILLRCPPHEPAVLFRAALVCTRWGRLLSSPAFRRRYREFHRRPPMLAFLSNAVADDPDAASGSRHVSHFAARSGAGTATCCGLRPWLAFRSARALDARHGRVLLQLVEEQDARRGRDPLGHDDIYQRIGQPVEGARGFFVLDLVANESWEVPIPWTSDRGMRTVGAAVLCSDTTGACDHLDCHRKPYLVVFVGYHFSSHMTFIYTYSSETATWKSPISTQRIISRTRLMPSAYVGNALYFGFQKHNSILKYDLQLEQISWIQLPSMCNYHQPNVFTTTEDGVLGLATIRRTQLYIWYRKDAPQVDDAGWTQPRVIELWTRVTVGNPMVIQLPRVVGFAEGVDVIFFSMNGNIFTIELKTFKANKFLNGNRAIYTLIPYMRFCTPALGEACPGEGPSAGGSSA